MHGSPAVRVTGLTKTFGTVQAVAGIDLEIQTGELVALVGPNGAGKTTTIRMLSGLLAPTAGTIDVMGRRVGPHDAAGRRLVGVCAQENVLYPELTARENLAYVGALFGVPRRDRRARADELLDAVGLADKATTRAEALSGGMKRRLTLALALVHDPPVVVLDEAESGLDPQSRLHVREFVRGLAKERTVLLTSHNMDEVDRLAKRLVFIDHGAIVADGAPAELKAKVGGGDTLALTFDADVAPRVAEALAEAGRGSTTNDGAVVTVRGLDLARRLPDVMATVAGVGAVVRDVRFVENTLEDAFIALTGRGLRE